MEVAPTVYVVDDDPAARLSLCALVKSRGLICEEFSSAEEFLQQVDLESIGAVIADLRMEGMSGLLLQATMMERGSLLPMIVVSGHADVSIAVQMMENGAVSLLQKPYDEHSLLKAIDRALVLNQKLRAATVRRREIERRLALLSHDEEQILNLIVDGCSNRELTRESGCSSRTIDRRRHSIFTKMQVETVAELSQMMAEYRLGVGSATGERGRIASAS